MLNYENVLVPLDFSTSSQHALKLAQSLVAPGGQVHTAHVHPKLAPHVRQFLFPYSPLGEDEVEFEWESLTVAKDKIEAFHGVEASEILLGDVREALPDLLHRSAAELIVMGAFGERAPLPDSLGATTERVLRTSRQPILVTRALHGNTVGSIMAAVDLSTATTEVLQAAVTLALVTGAALETIYILPDPLAEDPHGLLRAHVKFDRKQVLSRSKDKIDALFERAIEGIKVPHPSKDAVARLLSKRRVYVGTPASELLDRAEKQGIDVLVVGTQRPDHVGRVRLGGVAATVARRATCHTLVVPVSASAHDTDET